MNQAVQAVTLRSVKIQDNIKSTGELVAVVNGQSDPVDGVTYTWYRSKTGADGSWRRSQARPSMVQTRT